MLRIRRWLVGGFGFLTAFYVTAGAIGWPSLASFGLTARGDRVMAVAANGPAAVAGIVPGDRLRGLAPPQLGESQIVTVVRPDRAGDVLLTPAPASDAERARVLLWLVLAAAFVAVATVVLSSRFDRLTTAFGLFAFSAGFVLAPRPVWLLSRAGAAGPIELAGLGAALLLPAALVDFVARFPEGRPGPRTRGLVVATYAVAAGLFGVALLAGALEASGRAGGAAGRALTGGGLEALMALFFGGSLLAALTAFSASYRAAPAAHRARLTALVWAITFGLVPLALLTLVKNLAPGAVFPGERWAAITLLLVPLGFAYAILVHRVFDARAAFAESRGWWRRRRVELPTWEGFRPAPLASLRSVLEAAADELTARLGLEHCAVFAVGAAGATLTSMHGEPPRNGGGPGFLEHLPERLVRRLAREHAPLALEELGPGPSSDGLPSSDLGALAEAGTSLLVPLFAEDSCTAVLALGPRLSGPWFDAGERRALADFARQASVALENAVLHDRLVERASLEREVQLARQIQERLLPSEPPLLPTVELAAVTLPAGDIGGDYYDFMPLAPRSVGLAIADVCGKGLPAALLLAGVQAALRSRAEPGLAPGEVLARLNSELASLRQPEKFVCLLYARLDARAKSLRWANAGLNPPILVHPDGTFEEMPHGGLILGVSPGQRYDELERRFEAGSLVAFYTDGVTDARTGDELFGPERLGEALSRHRGLRTARLAERVLAEAAEWHRTGPADDRTLLIVKFL